MEGYSERLARRIDIELRKRGEDHRDLAHQLRVDARTVERWVTGETSPQRRLQKPIADYFGLPIEELWPDLELEEKRLRDQLNRIEAKLDRLLESADIDPASVDASGVADIEQAAAGSMEVLAGDAGEPPRGQRSPSRKRRAG